MIIVLAWFASSIDLNNAISGFGWHPQPMPPVNFAVVLVGVSVHSKTGSPSKAVQSAIVTSRPSSNSLVIKFLHLSGSLERSTCLANPYMLAKVEEWRSTHSRSACDMASSLLNPDASPLDVLANPG